MRWLADRDDAVEAAATTDAEGSDPSTSAPVEFRDICPLNETDEPTTSLDADACWTLGPVEERLASLQISARDVPSRVALRDLFARLS